jgi:hypothetical protein
MARQRRGHRAAVAPSAGPAAVPVGADALPHRPGPVDLLNARTVSTLFQKEIIQSGRLLYCADAYAVSEFDMLTLSYYQKLNEERKAILEAYN